MMDSVAAAIFWTQVPIAIGILVVVYGLWKVKKELVEILKKLAKK